jgi:pimeloyl-ACP methyl ester carboxylesterase
MHQGTSGPAQVSKDTVQRPSSRDLLYDFGGQGPVLHLAHANGFPPATYRPLAETLSDHFRVIALPARPLWPGSRPESAPDWHTLADDLIAGLDELGLRGIVGVGHSLGGVYTMFAAIRRPKLFRAVVLIDPVILPPAYLWVLRLMRRLGLGQRQPLVRGALRRRRSWPSREVCYERFRGKSLFANWPDASLHAYVQGGTRPRVDGQVELVYPVEWEAHIFSTPPVDVWRYVPKLRTRTLVIRGEHTNTFRPESQRRMAQKLPDARFHVVRGAGHLVPMELPVATGSAIREFLN